MISGLVRPGTKTILLGGDGDDLQQFKATNYNYRCIRYTYNHDDSSDFHKIIVAVYVGNSITPLAHFYVHYYFDNEEHPISFTNHMVTQRTQQRSFSILPIQFVIRSKT